MTAMTTCLRQLCDTQKLTVESYSIGYKMTTKKKTEGACDMYELK